MTAPARAEAARAAPTGSPTPPRIPAPAGRRRGPVGQALVGRLRRAWPAIPAALALLALTVCSAVAAPIVLPDGRALTPVGSMVSAGDFPAAALMHGSSLLVADAGEGPNFLVAFDTLTGTATSVLPASRLPPSSDAAPWAQSGGLALSPDGGTLYAGGGHTAVVHAFTTTALPLELKTYPVPGEFAGGVAAARDGTHLFVTEPFEASQRDDKGSTLVVLDTATGATRLFGVGRHPLAILDAVTAAGREVVVVANRDDGTVTALDARALEGGEPARPVIATVRTGRQPSALALTPDGSDLLVTNGLGDTLVDVSTSTWRVRQDVSLRLPTGIGAAPSAIAAGDRAAYVALSADNAIAVLRRGRRGWFVSGRIPTAWYPTSVSLDARRGRLLVTAGKGTGQPQGIPAGVAVPATQPYNPGSAGLGESGVLETIPLPSPRQLRRDEARVRANDRQAACVARRCGRPAALRGIDHVVYIIRENKTFDEELGDEPGGSRAGLLYGRATTPNTHALGERFALLERFYSDEEVSDTGHQAVMGGTSNDWVERFSQQAYGVDGAPRPGAELGNTDDVLWSPSDYLFDDALAHGVSFRDYGEFFRQDQNGSGAAVSRALDAHVDHSFPHFGFDPSYPDTGRAAYWIARFRQDVARRSFPALEVIYLPEDHTTEAIPPTPLPQQQVADSDLATGQIVGTISHSRYWRSTAIFLSEDDPQSGVDHVDEHRTVGLVVGAHVRRNLRSREHWDQAGMLRTIEVILGLPALTEFDATAAPLTRLFTAHADTRSFDALVPSPTRPAASRVAAVHSLALRLLGPRPDLSSVSPDAQRRVQWLAVRGRLP